MKINRTNVSLVVIACGFWGGVHAAGLQYLKLPATHESAELQGAIWSPCAALTETVSLRRLRVPGVRDCPVEGSALPMVVFSHGARGWFGGHHDTASALADAGFVVAAITHPDKSPSWQTERPAEMKRLIDHMLDVWADRHRLDGNRIGFFGFSRGGYTGLVMLGAKPDFRRIVSHCLRVPNDSLCRLMPPPATMGKLGSQPKRVYTHDSRVRAAVIAAPLGLVFAPSALAKVNIPIQLWRPEHDKLASYPYNAQAVFDGLSTKPDYRVVKNAGHFSILAPCSERQTQVIAALCRDSPGFDRVTFHRDFNEQVVRFFREHLRAK